MKTLKEQIRDGEIGSLYLFYGEERYLVQMNIQRLKRALMEVDDEMMNLDEVQGISDLDEFQASVETLPFMAERRLVIVHDSKAFAAKSIAALERLTDMLSMVPETTTLVFVEEDVDKRNRNTKAVEKYGCLMEFKRLEEKDLSAWIRSECKSLGMSMEQREIAYFLSLTGSDMSRIEGEIKKLSSYLGERRKVTREDIDNLVVPSVEAKVFSMTDAICEGRKADAYKVYTSLLQQGEKIPMILYMIIRQFRMLYRVSLMEGADAYAVQKELGLNGYVARNYIRQAGRFGRKRLQKMLYKLLELDEAFKTGQMSDEEAADLVLLFYA